VNAKGQLQHLLKFLEMCEERFRWFTRWQTIRHISELSLKPFCPCILALKGRANDQKSLEFCYGLRTRMCPMSHGHG